MSILLRDSALVPPALGEEIAVADPESSPGVIGRNVMKAIHAVIEGEVQGVGFRYSALMEARALGLTGWVRNAEDGSVEVWAEGEERSLDEFSRWLEHGPDYANVERALISREKAQLIYSSFSIVF